MMSSAGVGIKYTCLACRVAFVDADLQREHYKCEWHRYNLKRKVASLVSLSREDYEKIEAQHVKKDIEDTESVVGSGPEFYCECCRKSFGNAKAWTQHGQSKKHEETRKVHLARFNKLFKQEVVATEEVAKLSKTLEKATITTDDDSKNGGTSIEVSSDVIESLETEETDSDWESVSDDEEEGVLYGDPIVSTDCLFCTRSSKSLEENIQHMTADHSFFIPDADYLADLDGLFTYLGEKVGAGLRCLWCCDKGKRFASVIAVQRHMIDKGHCKMRLEPGETLLEYADYYDYTSSYPNGQKGEDVDEEVDADVLRVNDHMQLILPSGAAAGHRSLSIYYKQNLRATPLPRADNKKAILHQLLSQYRSLGWSGSNAIAVHQKAKDLQFLAKRDLKIGMTNNKVGQMYFRSQTLI